MNDAVTIRIIAGGLGAGLFLSLGGVTVIAAFGHDGQLGLAALTALVSIGGTCAGSLGAILISPRNGNGGGRYTSSTTTEVQTVQSPARP